MRRKETIPEIWLEVSNIALNEGEAGLDSTATIDVQLKGDSEDDRWLTFKGGVDKFKPLMEAMKDKRPIHAKLAPTMTSGPNAIKTAKKTDSGKPEANETVLALKITELRISFSASSGRT